MHVDPGFVWGAATSAYQIEGAAASDGREPSIWDAFCRIPGAIADGSSGDVACDHYHRLDEDVALLAGLGVGAYRFSVSWSRVLRADGAVNPAGLDFYDRLVDALLAARVDPWLTLYHWDLPAALPGGWLARDTASRFADYALAVHRRLGDRVRHWTTLNEPWCSAMLGYAAGVHAPGHTDAREAFTAAHHLLLAHGLAVRALRETDAAARLGITLNFTPAEPADPGDPADVDAVRRIDSTAHRLFLDPLFRGEYPADLIADAGASWPAEAIAPGDLATIAAPLDFLGVNYYTTERVRASGGVGPSPHPTAPGAVVVRRPELTLTDMGWEVDPSGLERLLVALHRDHTRGLPIIVTENGAAYADTPDAAGAVADADRIAYLREHLAAVERARAAGANVHGYFVWSLLDNFEWAQGYAKRFGLVRVEPDLTRVPKASYAWYAAVARAGLPPRVPR